MPGLFKTHGDFCASHPWEVIVTTLILTICILTVDNEKVPSLSPTAHKGYICQSPPCQEYNAVDVIIMTAIRCAAIVYSYYQFRNLHKLGSKYILGIAALFTMFSSFVFSSGVINFIQGDISDLEDALFFFLLLIDLSKATLLAQFALSASTQDEVKLNIARGVALLGPSLTLDTVVETLVIGVGTLSGIRRLEVLCYFACLSVIVNYVVFMTFYPACLSLILELTRNADSNAVPMWYYKSNMKEQDQKPNPVLQRVKIIMSVGLIVVHLHSRYALTTLDVQDHPVIVRGEQHIFFNITQESALQGYFNRWFTVSTEQMVWTTVPLIIIIALIVKALIFEDKDLINTEFNSKINMNGNANKGPVETFAVKENEVDNSYTKPADDSPNTTPRSVEECLEIYKSSHSGETLSDEEVKLMVKKGHFQAYLLEKILNNPERGVKVRREIISNIGGFTHALKDLPYEKYDYNKVLGACCENVVGYMPIPVGVAGPLVLDGQRIFIPMATTEGCLVASTNRGCRALLHCGVTSQIVDDGMTRGPVVRFKSVTRASQAMKWMQDPENYQKIKESFDSTSRFARLIGLKITVAGRLLFLRFKCTTGDAMGMNMASKGTEEALKFAQTHFTDMEIISLSGNYCADKKPAAINWINGRGKSVVCEAIVPAEVVKTVLKTSVQALVDVHTAKNLIGSAIAGSIGGFNAHAANIVTAIFIATGQDPAQNVGSSNCMTLLEPWGDDKQDLHVTCTMPSIETGTVGGGTQLPPQAACLDILGVRGAHELCPGKNSRKLARIICASVLAGELSLLSALASGNLVKSHLRHNRSSATVSDLAQQDKISYFKSPCNGIKC